MRRTKYFALFALALSLFMGCVEEPSKFDRPDWLAGKIFTQIEDSSVIFSSFAECLRITGFDTIINTSGSYTVFAPNNDAMDEFLTENGYGSVNDIPRAELNRIVKYHIVQNPWSKEQLRSLDVWGWIDPLDENNDEPKGFKRETLLKQGNLKYGVRIDEDGIRIVDTLSSPFYRRVFTDSRKFAPIFFKEYFDVYDLNLDDFEFYFGRSIEDPEDIFYVNAKIIGNEIFAENGFVYNIDKVVSPGRNAYEMLTAEYSDRSYSKFLELVNLFPQFEYNESETFDQPGAEQGLEVDSLFDLTFPDLAFHLTREKTKAPPGTFGLPGEVTIRYHHGLVAPTNSALEQFENEYLPGGYFWNGIDDAPDNIKRIIANTHLCINPIYRSDLSLKFYNGEQDKVTFDEMAIVQKEYGSNAAVLGVNEAIVPRAFSSVTGPIYLRKGYKKVMFAIEESGLLPALKRERDPNARYMLFVESDQNTSLDSSFLYQEVDDEATFFAYQLAGSASQRFGISKNDLRTLLLNHIAVREPKGLAEKEFIPNLAGNYLIFTKSTGEVSGTEQTSIGFQSGIPSQVIPTRIDINADNGSTWEIDDWFSFNTSSVYLKLSSAFPEFLALIVKAGLANTSTNEIKFLSSSENYTVFAPTAAALTEIQADTLEGEALKDFVKTHFVRKALIFTDGNQLPGYYETARLHESSNEFNISYAKFYIEPGVDEISIASDLGGTFTNIALSDSTNFICGQLLSEGDVTFPVMSNNAVIHKIDKALLYDELDVFQPSR